MAAIMANYFRFPFLLSLLLYLSDLIVRSSRSQWPCLQVIVLWENMQKVYSFQLTTSVVGAGPLR